MLDPFTPIVGVKTTKLSMNSCQNSNADLRVHIHMKQSGQQNIGTSNNVCGQKCGPGAGLVGNSCYCFGNSFEENVGDANNPNRGCKS